MSWAKWNDWNSLAKAAKHLAENAQKRIDKVLEIDEDENSGAQKSIQSVERGASANDLTASPASTQPPSLTSSQPIANSENFRSGSLPTVYPDAGSEIFSDEQHADDRLGTSADRASINDTDLAASNTTGIEITAVPELSDGDPHVSSDDVQETLITSLAVNESSPFEFSTDRISPFAVQSPGNDADGWQADDTDLLDASSESSDGPISTNDSGIPYTVVTAHQVDAVHDVSSEAVSADSQKLDPDFAAPDALAVIHSSDPSDDLRISAETVEAPMTHVADADVATGLLTGADLLGGSYTSSSLREIPEEHDRNPNQAVHNADSDEHAVAEWDSKESLAASERISETGTYDSSSSPIICEQTSAESMGSNDIESVETNESAAEIVLDGDDSLVNAITEFHNTGNKELCRNCFELEKDFQEQNAKHRSELAAALRAVDSSQIMLADITVRMVEVETKLDAVDDENKQLVHAYRNLEETYRSSLRQETSDDDSTKRQLQEQLQIVGQLRQEGTKLAEENFKLQQLIKKIRSKNKEHEASDDTLKATIAEQQAQLEALQKQNNEVRAEEKRLKGEVAALRGSLNKQEKQHTITTQELQEAKSRNVSLQTALESAFKDIAALEFQHTEQNSKAQESLLASEKAQQAELRRQLDETRQTLARERHDFTQQVEDVQRKHAHLERSLQLSREQHQRELADYQLRVEQAEALKEELQHSTAAAVQPYLRQIDQLQQELSASTLAWTDYEQRLTDKLRGFQQDLNDARKREHDLSDRCAQLEQRCADSETAARHELDAQTSELRKNLNEKLRELEQCKRDGSHAEAAHAARDREQRQMVETLERKVSQLLKQSNIAIADVALNEYAVDNLSHNAATPSLSGARPSDGTPLGKKQSVVPLHSQMSSLSRSGDAAMLTSAFSINDLVSYYAPQQSQRSGVGSTTNTTTMPLSTSASVANWLLSSPDPSFIEGWSAAGANDSALAKTLTNSNASSSLAANTADVYGLSSSAGAIMHYKSETDRLKANNDKLVHELASASTLAVELSELASRYAELQHSLAVLRTQNETLMQMYGERVEEVNELKEDLSEAKVAYKQQLELLTRQIEEARRKSQNS